MAVSLSMYITENSTSISNNTSSVTVDCYVSWTYGSWNNYGQCDAAITIDGTSYSFSGLKFNSSHTTSGSQWLMSKTANVYHNADGYKTVYCSAWFNTNVSSGTIYASGSKVLTYIPRAATLTAAPNFTDEDSPTISYSNPAGSAVTSLQACIASTDGATIYVPYRDLSKSGSSYTFNFTSAEQTTLQNACVNAKSMEMRFYVKTVISGNTYYSSLSKTLTIANAAPTLSPTATDTNSKSVALTGSANGILIKGYNTVSYAFNAAALKGATIKSYKVTCADKTGTAAQGTLSNVESGSVVFTVTDSRGNATTKTLTKTLIGYVPVTANISGKISLSESDNTKAAVSFTVSGNYFSGSFGATSNTLTLTYSLLNSSNVEAAQGTLTIPTSAYSGTTYSLSYSIPTQVDYKDSYTVKVTAADKLYTVTGTSKTLKAIPVFDWGEGDFNFNVPVTVQGTALIDLIHPIGSIYTSTEKTSPAELFGGTWEQIKDTFMLTAGDTYVAGETGGEATHTLTIDEAPKHYHYMSYMYGARGGISNYTLMQVGSTDSSGGNVVDSNNLWRYTSDTRGGGGAHNNMPPYIVVYAWKRVA